MSHGEFDPGQLTISKSMALGLDVSSPRGDNGYESDDSECVENANSRAVDRAIGVESDGGFYRPVAIIRKLGSKVGGLGLLLKSKKERAPRRTVVQALFGGKTAFSGTKDTIVRGGEFEFEFGTAVHQSGPVRGRVQIFSRAFSLNLHSFILIRSFSFVHSHSFIRSFIRSFIHSPFCGDSSEQNI